jgi:hypothetical protein
MTQLSFSERRAVDAASRTLQLVDQIDALAQGFEVREVLTAFGILIARAVTMEPSDQPRLRQVREMTDYVRATAKEFSGDDDDARAVRGEA